MSRDRDGAALLDRIRSRRWAIYAVWVAVLVVSFAAGGATLGLLVDYEAVGTDDDPNTIQVVGNWAGFAPANSAGNEGGAETGGPVRESGEKEDTGKADVTGKNTGGPDTTGTSETNETGGTNEAGMGNTEEAANVPPPTVGGGA